MKVRPLLREPTPFDDEAGTHLLVLHRFLLGEIGPEYVSWDSDALREEIRDRWSSLGEVTWQRVLAARLLASNDLAWSEWGVFEKVAAAVAGEFPDFAFVQPIEAEDIARTLVTMAEFDAEGKFDDDVVGYIAAACLHDGLWYLEAPLDVARDAMTFLLRTQGAVLPFDEVTALLGTKKGLFSDPDTAAQFQYNEVMGVRQDLEAFRAEVAAQARAFVKG